MPKYTRLLFLLLLVACTTQAQDDLFRETRPSLYHGSVEAQGIVTGKNTVPFWMRSDQWGSVPLPGASGALIASGWKSYDSSNTHFFDWGGGFELRADAGSDSSRLRLIQGYIKVRGSIFELKAGRFKETMGLVDSSLSSGAFSISDNALPIPKIEGSIPEFFTIPIFGGLFAFKGNFAHGWVGTLPFSPKGNVLVHAGTYFHQASLYGRLGKPGWRLHLYGGINHQAFWGNEQSTYGKGWGLSTLQTFEKVIFARTWHGSKVGQHLGSLDQALEYEFDGVRLLAYHQFLIKKGGLAHGANLDDGLSGISITNKQDDDAKSPDYYPLQGSADDGLFHWHKIVVEFFYSKDQAGYPWSKLTPAGDENYYNNAEYPLGWSYKGMGLGNPFITPYNTTRAGLPNDSTDYFNNNRVIAIYGALQGSISDYRFTARGSYSVNYGTYGTSPWGHHNGRIFYKPRFGQFPKVTQLSGWLSVERDFDPGWTVGCIIAADRGKLFYDGGGFILRVKKSL